MKALRRWIVFGLLIAGIPIGATDLEREAREIEDLLMSPCCFRQQVSVHQSPTATEVRRDIRARLARGEPRQAILDAYVAEHGSAVLVVPPAEGSNLVLYVLPPLILAGSVLLVVGLIRRFSASGAHHAPAAPPAPTPDRMLDDRLTDELRDLD